MLLTFIKLKLQIFHKLQQQQQQQQQIAIDLH